MLPSLLERVEDNSTSRVDVVFEAGDVVKNDPAELHVANSGGDFVDVVLPKAWMHYGNRLTMVLGGLIDHSHGKHLYLHPQPFWPKDANLVISTLFHHIHSHIIDNLTPDSCPSVLYLQADNCAAENKNVFMLSFLSLLISLDVFKEVYLSFLLVGHTHEDIDQLFSTAQTKFHSLSIHTPRYASPMQLSIIISCQQPPMRIGGFIC